MSTAPTPDVRPGQVWADNDPRSAGRTLRVESVADGIATCTVITNMTRVQEALDAGHARRFGWSDRRGSTARIRVDRMHPTRTGYRLLQDAPGGDR